METTHQRIVRLLAEIAHEDDDSFLGSAIAFAFAMGGEAKIAAMLPDNDVDADRMLEEIAVVILGLRSVEGSANNPFEVAQLSLEDPAVFTDA